MTWLERNLDKRLDPSELFSGARTVISLSSAYFSENYVADCGISRYAVGRDYHKVLKRKGQNLLDEIKLIYKDVQGRVFVDSAPIMEREWARKAGLGWVGKNGCLIQPKKGSWFFLAEIVLNVDIEPDAPFEINLCGSCTRCIQACPTQALLGDGLLDAARCISYLTIEQKDAIGLDPIDRWDNWIFGCDICQEVCPWNRQALSYQFQDFTPRENIMKLSEKLEQRVAEDEIDEILQGTALNRAGSAKLQGNYLWVKDVTRQIEAEE